MGIFKRGRNWYVRLEIDGKEIWRSAGPSREAARALLARIQEEAARRKAGLPVRPAAVPTLQEYAPRYLQWAEVHKRSYERDKWNIKQLIEAFGNLRLDAFDKTTVEAWAREELTRPAITRPGKTVSPATVNRSLALLRRILSRAVVEGLILDNPLKGIKLLREPPPRNRRIDDETLGKIIAHGPKWFRLFVRMAIAVPARAGDLLALRWRDVDLDRGFVTLLDRKTQKSRTCPLPAALIDELRGLRGLPDGPVFVVEAGRYKGRVPTVHAAGQAWREACRKVGVTGVRLHDLRHEAMSRLLEAGASIAEVMSLSGHREVPTVLRYTHASPKRLKELVSAISLPEPAPVTPAPVVKLSKKKGDNHA